MPTPFEDLAVDRSARQRSIVIVVVVFLVLVVFLPFFVIVERGVAVAVVIASGEDMATTAAGLRVVRVVEHSVHEPRVDVASVGA